MKNLSLILNAILIVAVAYLYYDEFSDSDDTNSIESAIDAPTEGLSIAYVNSDTLLANYKYYEEVSKSLEIKSNNLQQEYARRAQGLQKQFEDYQKTRLNMTMGQANAVEEDLAKKRQNLLQFQESINQQLYQEQAKITQALFERVTKFLKAYGEEHNLQVVLTYAPGSGVWYADKSLDITSQVITGLNSEHDATGAISEADTTATQ